MNLNDDEKKVLKMILLKIWCESGSLSFQEMLCDESESEAWLIDVVTDLTEKVGITPEETW
jgi:hypothetical protein